MKVQARNRTMLAWLLFAATFVYLAAGLAVALALVRPLTVGVLAGGALAALLYLGFAVLGLILSLPARQPDRLAVCRLRTGLVPERPGGRLGR